MSFAIWNWLEKYARWREDFLKEHPWKRLIPELPEDYEPKPLFTWGDKAKNIGILLAVGLVLFALAGSGDSK